MLTKIYSMVQKYTTKFDIFKMSHKPVDAFAYWKRLEGIDQPVRKKRH